MYVRTWIDTAAADFSWNFRSRCIRFARAAIWKWMTLAALTFCFFIKTEKEKEDWLVGFLVQCRQWVSDRARDCIVLISSFFHCFLSLYKFLISSSSTPSSPTFCFLSIPSVLYVCMYVCMYVLYACMHVCIYVCMYVCMYGM